MWSLMLQTSNNSPPIFFYYLNEYFKFPLTPRSLYLHNWVFKQSASTVAVAHLSAVPWAARALLCRVLGSGFLQRGARIIINLPGLSRTPLVIWNCWVSTCERSWQGKVVMGDGSLLRTEWWIWHPAGRVWGVENMDYTLVFPTQAFSNKSHIYLFFLSRDATDRKQKLTQK